MMGSPNFFTSDIVVSFCLQTSMADAKKHNCLINYKCFNMFTQEQICKQPSSFKLHILLEILWVAPSNVGEWVGGHMPGL